eukprot:scaffold9517_cov117-Isochrysis_galbana.AAC.2
MARCRSSSEAKSRGLGMGKETARRSAVPAIRAAASSTDTRSGGTRDARLSKARVRSERRRTELPGKLVAAATSSGATGADTRAPLSST